MILELNSAVFIEHFKTFMARAIHKTKIVYKQCTDPFRIYRTQSLFCVVVSQKLINITSHLTIYIKYRVQGCTFES